MPKEKVLRVNVRCDWDFDVERDLGYTLEKWDELSDEEKHNILTVEISPHLEFDYIK